MGKAISKPQRPAAIELQTIPKELDIERQKIAPQPSKPTPKEPAKMIPRSRLLTLPPELRLEIYHHYLANRTLHLLMNQRRPALLATCSLIRQELMEPYKAHLLAAWVSRRDNVRKLLAKFLVTDFGPFHGEREYSAISFMVHVGRKFAFWFAEELMMMDREGLLAPKDRGLGMRVKLEAMELHIALLRL